jgi:hypothetical protein
VFDMSKAIILGVAVCRFSTIDFEFFGSSIEFITEWLSLTLSDAFEIQAQSCQIKLPSLGNVNPISLLSIFLNSSLLIIAKSTSPLIKSSFPFLIYTTHPCLKL